MHTDKTKILKLHKVNPMLGFRVLYYYKLLKRSNIRKIRMKMLRLKDMLGKGVIDYNKIYATIEGWIAYAKNANTLNLRVRIMKLFEQLFPNQVADVEIQRWLKYAET